MAPVDSDRELRLWAARQLEHDKRLLDDEAYAAALRDERIALEQGHVSPRMFYAADDFFEGLHPLQPIARPIWLAKINEIGQYWLRLGPYQGGFIPGYVTATQAHLRFCSTCQERVISQLIEEFQSLTWVRGVLRTAGI
jgi:hypothetical protein